MGFIVLIFLFFFFVSGVVYDVCICINGALGNSLIVCQTLGWVPKVSQVHALKRVTSRAKKYLIKIHKVRGSIIKNIQGN